MRSLAALSGALAVAFGAFGAHALKARCTPDQMAVWTMATQYHLAHSVALLFLARPARATLSFKLMSTGILLFSGSLYLLVLSEVKRLGALTPVGGVLLIAGWCGAAASLVTANARGQAANRQRAVKMHVTHFTHTDSRCRATPCRREAGTAPRRRCRQRVARPRRSSAS